MALYEPVDLRAARSLAAAGRYEAAREAYIAVLREDADCLPALVELGALAQADGYLQAADSAFARAVGVDRANAVALTGLGNVLMAREDYRNAKSRFAASLAAAPDFAPAHQGLARCLSALGEDGAEPHWQAGYRGHAIEPGRAGAPVKLLLLAAARGGNLPCKSWIDPQIFTVTTVYLDFFEGTELPPHALVLNAIGDADICGAALARASRLLANNSAPVINPPELVAKTSRAENAARLRAIPGVVTPRIEQTRRAELRAERLRFPVLLRSLGFHTGQNFVLVQAPAGLEEAAAVLPGNELLAIEYLDARGADGLARKYRAMFIGSKIYPLHLAAGADWKVHYFTSAMAEHAALRAQEQRFLEDMPGMLGPKAMAALQGTKAALGLDYAGVDFALGRDGSLILFEANATMAILEPDASPIWDYRRPAIAAAHGAAQAMLRRKVQGDMADSVDFPVR